VTRHDIANWWERLGELATNGPKPGEYAEAEPFIAEAERLIGAARELLRPRAVTPSHARLLVNPVSKANGA
jgi:hypothetical protein